LLLLLLFIQFYGDNWKGIFEAITGYGLGGSSIALFGRVGGGIYTKVGWLSGVVFGVVNRCIGRRGMGAVRAPYKG
jgi:inorganic pyrophosphatase